MINLTQTQIAGMAKVVIDWSTEEQLDEALNDMLKHIYPTKQQQNN